MDTQNSHLPPIVYSRCLDNFHIWKSDHAYYIIGPPVRATTGFALERDGFITGKTLTLSLLRIRVLHSPIENWNLSRPPSWCLSAMDNNVVPELPAITMIHERCSYPSTLQEGVQGDDRQRAQGY